MKTTRRRLALVIGHSSLVISSAAILAADDASLRPIAFQNGVNQQSLGAETAELARAIDALIDELQRNGFPVQSLAGLSELAAQLNALGGTEMSAIASRLRKLGENAQADPRATATEAYLAQQAIETRLKSLARQISIQRLREEAARRLETLIARQLATQRETRAIAAAKADAERQRILESDQTGIGEDLSTFFQTGENLLARLRENPAAPAPAPAAPAGPTFAERINGAYLTTLSTEAVDHLKGKRYPDAYGRQEALLAELRKILQGILSSLPKEQRLANALQQVSALRQQEEARAKTDTATPESKQATADQAKTLADQVAALSPEAAAALKKAAEEALKKEETTETPPEVAKTDPKSGDPSKDPGKSESDDTAKKEDPKGEDSKAEDAEAMAKGEGKPEAKDEKGPENKDGTPPQPGQTPATEALAAAEAALQKALAQTQQQNSQGQPQNQQGQQQAGTPPQPGQQQPGQQQTPQQGKSSPTSQIGQIDGKAPDPNQKDGNVQSGLGDAQNQIAGRGPSSDDPAQVVGALRREEREAFNALQGERYPAEYSAWVQQYWRNLARDQ
jgi:hypothetical protein